MSKHLILVADLLKKSSQKNWQGNAALNWNLIEAFMVFSRRKLEEGKNLLKELEIEKGIQKYYTQKGKKFKWEANLVTEKKEDLSKLKTNKGD